MYKLNKVSVACLFITTLLTSLHAIKKSWNEVIRNKTYTFEILDNNDSTSEEKLVFIRSFSKQYENISLEVLQIKNLEQFLTQAFEGEAKALKNCKNGFTFIHVKDKEKIVALTTVEQDCEIDKTGALIQKPSGYISSLAVDPSYEGKGIGTKLVQTALSLIHNLQCMKVNTRKINTKAIAFYKKLGFKETTERNVHEGLNKDLYEDLEYKISA